jgi:hypothetical protein
MAHKTARASHLCAVKGGQDHKLLYFLLGAILAALAVGLESRRLKNNVFTHLELVVVS